MGTDTMSRDQDTKNIIQEATKLSNGVHKQAHPPTPESTSTAAKAVAAAARPKEARKSGAKPLAMFYIALAVAAVCFLGSLGPVIRPTAFTSDSTGIAHSLKAWSPLPQAFLFLLVLALAAAVVQLRSRRPAPTEVAREAVPLPLGVAVNKEGVLVDESGLPLARGYKLVGTTIVSTASGAPLPPYLKLGPGGVLLHAHSGRVVPHCCSLGPHGGLLSSCGKTLPDSMAVGPNCCLVAADGSVLSPDLQPVPEGFGLSSCGKYLLRPNKKAVPRGVHVGPGFRLLKPTGELMPDGVRIGPCSTIICADDTILTSDGSALPSTFKLSADKTQIIDPEGNAIEDGLDMGPNCTVIDKQDRLLTALGRVKLDEHFALGPLGNLLLKGCPVPATAAFNAKGHLLAADGQTVLYRLAK